MSLVLDKRLTSWQLYHMAINPDFEPILPLIVLHDHAYAALQAWYEQYQETGEFGIVPKPSEPEARGLFARQGRIPSLRQVDAYVQEQQGARSGGTQSELSDLPTETLREDAARDLPLQSDQSVESFDDSVTLGFDWRVVKRAGIAVVMCAVLVGLVIGGVQWHRHTQQQRFTQAQADCRASIQQVQDRQRAWQRLVDTASTKQALAYIEQDVADKQVLTQLHHAAQPPKITLHQCTGDTVSALQDVTNTHTALADTLTQRTSVLRKAIQAVQSSHRKQLDGQRGELQVAINGAQALLDSSSGNVADDATRDALARAIAQARSVYQDNNVSDIQSYITAGKSLVDAQAAVQASIDAKVQADERAKQQAAQDAQPQAATPSPHYVTAPQRTAPAAPQAPTPPTWSVPAPSSNPLPDSDGSL
ncbi:hypothetical protein GCM10007377_12320 [Galliscardovia ingluviei]|uniref:Molecular chaperone n=1 Tax=Galliscardovia ingluviei TaxID=1769422 RepID=A0A8J3AQY6_9BIFI|nr:hypothetical protein [Galliscardovia ingluviei]GGI14718.1 hypothetical protein GCM10007377_12320 [Galliscardovia ingluviei]